MEKIVILLATYNGERYIKEMVDSIIAQDYPNWQLVLSDDCSSDSTPQILQSYAQAMPEKIIFHRSGLRFGNAQNHFMYLLKTFCDAPYIMFCDQDDVWHVDKVRKTYEKMKEIESSVAIPAMVHTDLNVVDGNLKCLNPSFMQMSSITGDRLSTRQLLTQNVVTGCTMMMNCALAKLATENIPDTGIAMHDWWIAILASTCGDIGYLDEATIDYRQHGKNSVGAKNVRSFRHIFNQLKNAQMSKNIKRSFEHAEVFLACFGDKIPEEKARVIQLYVELGKKNVVARRIGYIKYGFWKAGILRQIGQLLMG